MSDGISGPNRMSQVRSEVENINSSLDRLQGQLNMLAERLSNVMQGEPPQPAPKESAEPGQPMVPLANDLSNINNRINVAADTVANYIQRIEA